MSASVGGPDDPALRSFQGDLREHALAGKAGRTYVTHLEEFIPGEHVVFHDRSTGQTCEVLVVTAHMSDVTDLAGPPADLDLDEEGVQ